MPESSFPIGRRITLPGHFVGPVVLESVQPIGDGFECRVSLPDGMSGQTTLSRLEARSILDRRLRLTETSVAVEDQLCKVTIPHQLGRSIIGSAPKADDGPDRKETVVQAKSTRRWIGDTTLVGNSDAQPGREEPPGSRRVGITALPDGPGVAGSHYTTRPDSADHGTAPFNAPKPRSRRPSLSIETWRPAVSKRPRKRLDRQHLVDQVEQVASWVNTRFSKRLPGAAWGSSTGHGRRSSIALLRSR